MYILMILLREFHDGAYWLRYWSAYLAAEEVPHILFLGEEGVTSETR